MCISLIVFLWVVDNFKWLSYFNEFMENRIAQKSKNQHKIELSNK